MREGIAVERSVRLVNNQSSYANFLKNYNGESHVNFTTQVNVRNTVELQYLILLLQSLEKKNSKFEFNLLLEPSDRNKKEEAQRARDRDRAQISHYLACFSNTMFNEKPVFSVGNNAFHNKWLQYSSNVSFGRIIPFIPINYEMYRFLSNSVINVFNPSLAGDIDKHFNVSCEIVSNHNIDKRNNKEKVIKKFMVKKEGSYFTEDRDDLLKCDDRRVLYNACMNYLFNIDNRSSSNDFYFFFESRINEYASTEFFAKVKDISVLSFLIFCANNRFNLLEGLDNISKTAKRATYDSNALKPLLPNGKYDNDILINSMDMADGLLQLIENIVFHAGQKGKNNGTGLLSFRIFKKGQESWDEYLKPKYTNYFDGHDNRLHTVRVDDSSESISISSLDQLQKYKKKGLNVLSEDDIQIHLKNLEEIKMRKNMRDGVPFFLEVKLIDNSGKNMCKMFTEEHGGNSHFTFENVSMSTIFNPTEEEYKAWKCFNSNSDNLVHHYGLQLFDALVQSVDGCFVAQSIGDCENAGVEHFYSTSGDLLPEQSINEEYFKGTQYSILFPFYRRKRKDYSFINTHVEYPLPESKYNVIDKNVGQLKDYVEMLIKFGKRLYFTQKEKNEYVSELSKKLPIFNIAVDTSNVFIFDSEDLNFNNIELFAKSLMKYIADINDKEDNKDKEINIAIINCEDDKFRLLVRIFAIFYDRTGNNIFMENVQIYLSGKNSKDEFLLAGSNLKDTLVAQIKLDAARGITREAQTGILAFLLDMLERRPGKNTGKALVKYIPFDLLIECKISPDGKDYTPYNPLKLRIFEKNVLDVLVSDMQGKNPGYRIAANHMRIGSKIHVNLFYEGLVLFSNNYYTGRFAWLLKKTLKEKINIESPTTNNPFLFIGYETYSEMLLRDLCKLYGLDKSAYCVFEYGMRDMAGEKNDNRFRNIENLDDRNYTIIYVVPINSTLSTFNKLEAEFDRHIDKNEYGNLNRKLKNASVIYLGVIQTINHEPADDGVELLEKFFGKIDLINRNIESKLINPTLKVLPKVHYLFCVTAKWSNPLRCKLCYPENYLIEEPLIETDKTSVIPTQLYGLKKEEEINDVPNQYIHSGDIDDLKGCIVYGHSYRGSNHFKYYIQTDKFFRKISIDNKCKAPIWPWLKEVKEKVMEQNRHSLHYDIIVCPEHYSNAGFVKSVNDIVFNGVALVIGINFGKEFRDNFKTKHSDLSNIYNNLKEQNCEAEINFHFVDDTIIQGSSITRVKSLTHSLFPGEAYLESNKIRIRVFKTVIILINRNSEDSIMNFVSRREDFHAFFNLRISSLRTHENACILCQETNDSKMLGKKAALNGLSKYFSAKAQWISQKDVFDSYKKNDMEWEEREFLRFRGTHELNETFSKLCSKGKSRNEKCDVLIAFMEVVIEEMKKSKPHSIDVLISYITVASTPFLSFRKSIREAIFDLIIVMFEFLLDDNINIEEIIEYVIQKGYSSSIESGEEEQYEKDINNSKNQLIIFIELVKDSIINSEDCKKLVNVLMRQSVLLKSNYIIRFENIIRLLRISVIKGFRKCFEETNFIDYYLYNIKKLISTGTDEAKAMFLEYMILTGMEYNGDDITNTCKLSTLPKKFSDKYNKYIYMDDRLDENMKKELSKSLSDLLRNLYLENTQIIYDAAKDLKKNKKEIGIIENGDADKGVRPQKISRDIYYLDNYIKMLLWNSENENEISPALARVMRVLEEEPKKHEKGVLGYFSSLADALASLLSASLSERQIKRKTQTYDPVICFLGERSEQVLIIDDDNGSIVRFIDQNVLDCFATSNDSFADEYKKDSIDEVARIIDIAQEIAEDEAGFILNTYNHKEGKYYLFNIGGIFRGYEYLFDDLERIRIAVYFKDNYPEYQRLKAIRYLLTFNQQISDRIDGCLKGDLLSKELRNLATKKQIQKARAGDHLDEESNDNFSPKLFVESIYLKGHDIGDFYYTEKEALYGYYINSTMGRINIKLLAESSNRWHEILTDNDPESQIINRFCNRLTSVSNIPRKQLIRLLDYNSGVINYSELGKYFLNKFNNRTLLRNQSRYVPRFDYLVAFIAELINSAKKHGKKSANNLYDVFLNVGDDGYLYVSNEVNSSFNMDMIKNGIGRKYEGISLATTCGFFDYFYRKGDLQEKYAPRVRIFKEGDFINIGLPLLEAKVEEEIL